MDLSTTPFQYLPARVGTKGDGHIGNKSPSMESTSTFNYLLVGNAACKTEPTAWVTLFFIAPGRGLSACYLLLALTNTHYGAGIPPVVVTFGSLGTLQLAT